MAGEEENFTEELKAALEKKLRKWPPDFPSVISKKQYNILLAEYRQVFKFISQNEEASELTDIGNIDSQKLKENNHGNSEESNRFRNTPRIIKIRELQEKLKALKGKSLGTKDSLKRRGLKNRLIKKLKLEKKMEERTKNHEVIKEKFQPVKISVKTEKLVKKEVNKENIVYSKFDFPESAELDSKRKKGPIDPMRMLQKVEKSKKKLREMESRGRTEKVKEVKDRIAWNAAIKKAEGVKVKDDVELLKKSIKKKKNLKNRSKKKWDEREQNKVQRMEDVQKKRKTNIKKKKTEQQKKKVKKLIKKGRIVPS